MHTTTMATSCASQCDVEMVDAEFTTPSPPAVLRKIKELVLKLVAVIEEGNLPGFKIASYRQLAFTSAKTIGEENRSVFQRNEKERTVSYAGSGRRLVVMLRILLISQKLIQQKKHATKRDVYYTDPKIFKDQAAVDRGINDICIMFQCSRSCLNVVSVSKGLIMGSISYVYAGQSIHCSQQALTALPVPVHIDQVTDIRSDAAYILLVEKETVFQRLANDNFSTRHRCILLTGKGYPDVATRSFLRLLATTLGLPIYGLVDSDPYGLDILSTYRFGSLAMAHEAETLAVTTVRWLGLFISDCERFNIPPKCLLPMSKTDHKKAERMLKKSYLEHLAPAWWSQLEAMRTSHIKLKIEAISAVSLSQLAEVYIPTKIQEGPI